MGLKEFLETNPVLVTQGAAAFTAVCGALGFKEILKAMYDRYCRKADEKEIDHKKLEDLTEKMNMVLDKLEHMENNDKTGMRTDLIILETDLAEIQNRAIVKGKVSATCMPRYLKNFELYIKLANETEDYEASQEVILNHQRILKLVQDGHVADSIEEWYK